MENRKPGVIRTQKNSTTSKLLLAVIMSVMLSMLTCGLAFAGKNAPMTPELAAKKETVRKQKEQRVTHTQRKSAADALKAERLKVYNAKQHVKKSKEHKIEEPK